MISKFERGLCINTISKFERGLCINTISKFVTYNLQKQLPPPPLFLVHDMQILWMSPFKQNN